MASQHETSPFLNGLLRRPGLALVLLIGIELLFSGARTQDHNLLSYFGSVLSGSAEGIPPDRQWLLESLIPNQIGAALTRLGLRGFSLFWAWWTLGLALLAGAFWWAVRAGRLSIYAVIALFAVSRLVDTLSLWVFKADPYLLAFVILALSASSGWLAIFFLVLAGLCHPPAAALAGVGIGVARYMTDRRWEPRWFVGAVLAMTISETAVHFIVGPISGRLEHNFAAIAHAAARGLLTTPPAVLGTMVLPGLTFAAIGAALGKSMPSWRTAMPFLVFTAGVAFLSQILTEDHTRAFTLPMLGAMAVIAQHLLKDFTPDRRLVATDAMVIGVLVLARLVAPHIDGGGARIIELYGFLH